MGLGGIGGSLVLALVEWDGLVVLAIAWLFGSSVSMCGYLCGLCATRAVKGTANSACCHENMVQIRFACTTTCRSDKFGDRDLDMGPPNLIVAARGLFEWGRVWIV